jgi:hypothetical protein
LYHLDGFSLALYRERERKKTQLINKTVGRLVSKLV